MLAAPRVILAEGPPNSPSRTKAMADYKLLINGALVDGDAEMDVINPASEELVAKCPRASKAQLDAAVAAAQAAFPAWRATPIAERKAKLTQIADIIQANAQELG